MNYQEVKEYLNSKHNFETVQELPVSEIITNYELRKCCEQNLCGKYGKTWSCPPAIQDFTECEKQLKQYSMGLLIHQSYEMEDEYDYETMFESGTTFAKDFREAYLDIKTIDKTLFALSAGGCTICNKCAYPENPCRFPEKMLSSLESYGIYVLDLAKKCNVSYRKSPKHIDYYGMIFIK